MTCERGADMTAYLTNFEFVDAIVCQFVDPLGLLVVGLLIYGALAISFFIRTGSPMIPFALALLTGGAISGHIAGPGVAFAMIVMLTIIGGIPVYLYFSYAP